MRSAFPTSPYINSCNAHFGQPHLHPIRWFSYCILHDRLQQAFKCNMHPQLLSLKRVSSNDFFFTPPFSHKHPWCLYEPGFDSDFYFGEVIFICYNKCSLVRYQHTLLFPFTTSDVGKIRFCCQIVDLMISFLFLVQLSANSASFSLWQQRLNLVTVHLTHQIVCYV